MQKTEKIRLIVVLVLLAILTVVCALGGEEQSVFEPLTAKLTELSGKVQVLKASEGEFSRASLETEIEVNDQVLTGEDGRVRMDLSDGTIVRLSPLSTFTLKQIENTAQGALTRLELTIGRVWIILKGGVLEVETPNGLASVRGSYLHVWVEPNSGITQITCLEGVCTLGNDLGTINLLAGQTAAIENAGQMPQSGRMSHADVEEWLAMNPEATDVVVPLTATVAAGEDQPLPEAKTNTPTPTNTVGPSPTASMTPTPTHTLIAANCGPPLGWVLHTVRVGETLESLSALYRVDEADIRRANCRGEMTFIVPGEKLYVPNVATSTPTTTPTPTSTPDRTLTATVGSGSGGGSGTATPTDSPTTMSSPVGPDNTTISSLDACKYSYRIKVVDADGVKEVRLIWTFDGSLPLRDKAISAGYYKTLSLLSNDVFSVSNYTIDATGKSTPVHIRFRFVAVDDRGNVTYFPTNDAYDLTDEVNCGPVFGGESGPTGTIGSCSQNYQIDISDPDGVAEVKLLYNVDGVNPTWTSAQAAGDYYTMSLASGITYKTTRVIDVSVGSTNVVRYVFAYKDGAGNIQHKPSSGSYTYTDPLNCGETTWSNTISPNGIDITDGNFPSCTQVYSIDVDDANGISMVQVDYTISDGIIADGTGSFPLVLDTGTTYKTNMLIDTFNGGFTSPATVDFEFRAKDNLGHWTTMFTGSFTDSYLCGQ